MKISDLICRLQEAQQRLGDRPLCQGVLFGGAWTVTGAVLLDGDHLQAPGHAVLWIRAEPPAFKKRDGEAA